MDSQLYGQLIFDKVGKNTQWKKDSLSNQWCWENWTNYMENKTGQTTWRIKLDHFLTP